MFCTKASATALFLALVLPPAAGFAHDQIHPPPISDYVSNADFRNARLSPDGTSIAMVAPKTNHELLLILDADTQQVKASWEAPVNTNVHRFMWANEERIVFETSVNFGGGDLVQRNGNLYMFNVPEHKLTAVAGPDAGDIDGAYTLLSSLPSDHDHILVVRKAIHNDNIGRSQPEVQKIDLYNRQTSGRRAAGISHLMKSPLPWGEIFTDNNGQIRLAYATGEDGTLQVKLKEGDEQWLDITSSLQAGKSLVSPQGRPLGFNSTSTSIYYFTRGPTGTVGIAQYDIASTHSTLVYAHPRYDVQADQLIWSADGKELVGVTVLGAQAETHYFSEHDYVAFHRGLQRALPDHTISILNFASDQRRGLAMVSSSTMPPQLFMIDRNSGALNPLFSSRPHLLESPLTQAEALTISARDGTAVEAYLTRAAGTTTPAPLIVLIHGGPHNTRDVAGFDPEVKLLASRGYSVLQVNYRGSGGYGMDFQQAGYRHWGTTMIDDIVDATRYVADRQLVNADQICAMGGSFGGYAAMMALARYPELFKCGVGISGVYDLNLVRRSDLPTLPGGDDYLDQVLGSNQQELDANSPVKLAAAIKVPVFLAHGGADSRAPVKNAESFKRALDVAHVKYEWFYVSSAGHGFTLPANREKLYTELFRFFATYLHQDIVSPQLAAQ